MTVHRLVRALLSQGLTDAVLDLLTSADQPGWARLLESGASFTWESWELVEGTDYSQSHAWSASVLKEILESLLGIRITAPGGSEVLIEPPVCRLEHAEGSVPLPNGHVAVSWHRTAAGMELECTVPAGVAATVRLPAARYGVQSPTSSSGFVASGTANAAAAAAIGSRDTVDFRIHAGTWTFVPFADS